MQLPDHAAEISRNTRRDKKEKVICCCVDLSASHVRDCRIAGLQLFFTVWIKGSSSCYHK